MPPPTVEGTRTPEEWARESDRETQRRRERIADEALAASYRTSNPFGNYQPISTSAAPFNQPNYQFPILLRILDLDTIQRLHIKAIQVHLNHISPTHHIKAIQVHLNHKNSCGFSRRENAKQK